MIMLISRRVGEVSRVGVDLDGHCGFRLIYFLVRARLYGEPRCYYTKHGFHIEVKLKQPVDYGSALDIRMCLGDDPDRIAVDAFRVNVSGDCRRFDTLFVGRLKDGEGYVRKEIKVF